MICAATHVTKEDSGFIQLELHLAVLLGLVKPLGAFMARVYQFGPLFGLENVLGPVERVTYKAVGVRINDEQDWKQYAMACLAFNLVVYVLQRVQGMLPLNPAAMGAVTPDSSFNTATSFATNTNCRARRRVHYELPHANARSHGPELRLHRNGHGGARGLDPRHLPEEGSGPKSPS